jgi:hypothetical protein
MSSKAIGLSVAVIVLSGGFGLAMVGKAAAEAATGKCAIEWKQAKANGTTGGKTWKEFFDQCGADQNGLSRSLTLTPVDAKPGAVAPAAATAAPAAATPATSAAAPSAAPAPAATSASTSAVAPVTAAAVDTDPVASAPAKPAKKVKATTLATAAGQFANEADAKTKCPTDEVVWVNIATKKFHFAGHDGYGKSKKGAYMCEADATAAGAHASKGEKQL